MNLATLDVPRDEARRAFADYRKAVRERHNAEDEQIMRGYREIIRGRQLIDIVATIREGGTVTARTRPRWNEAPAEIQLPALAVMRADQKWCRVAIDQAGRVAFHPSQWGPRGQERRNVVRLPQATLPARSSAVTYSMFRAMVPPVPPALRPNIDLGNFHVLWEAEWEAQAPKDPALLRHLGGDLYAVIATWDLSELERAVLAGRFRAE